MFEADAEISLYGAVTHVLIMGIFATYRRATFLDVGESSYSVLRLQELK